MNNIFIKNLQALSQKNIELAKKLQAYIPLEVPNVVKENNAYNLLYKNKLIHNPQNPLAEANEIFDLAENKPDSIHLIYGLGLGYLFQLASMKSKGSVILYEPDLNIIWISFTLVDFSNDILKRNVYITSTIEELSKAIHQNSGTDNSPVLLSLPTQREFDVEGFDLFVKKIQDIIGMFYLDLKYTKQKFYPSLKLMIKNFKNLVKDTPLAYYKDFYKGKTAVIVSAGPTLDRDIEILKKYRDRYILFTVGTAVQTLYRNGLKPDFLCIIESYDSSGQLKGLDLKDVNFITEPFSNPTFREFEFKKTFIHISSNAPINSLYSEIFDENIEEYLSKGTVSYTALNSARLLGCSKIILVGQDLAYIEGQCYSKDSAYKDLSCEYNNETKKWEITAKDFEKFANEISSSPNPVVRENAAKRRLNNLNKSLYYVKGINGDMIPTESVYAAFVEPLQEYTKIFSDRKYINSSLVGAQIDGFENLSLEEALKNEASVGVLNFDDSFKFDDVKIVEILKDKVRELKTAQGLIEEGKKSVKTIKNEIKRYRMINPDVLKILKKITANYLELSSNFASQSKMFDFIVTADRISVDYEMKMLKDFSLENIMTLIDKITLFYENAEKRILEIEGIVNESFNTKS